jgi:ribosomal RNA-processing protein 36
MKQQHLHHDSDSDSDGPPEEVERGPHSHSAPSDDDEQPSSSGRSHSSNSSSSGADSDDSDADLDEQEQVLEQRLAEYPLEVVTQQMRDGQGPTGAIARAAAAAAKQQVFHRETKNRPQQLSSKRPVSRFREVIQVPKQ